jgi:hypothetical protein
MSAGTTVRFSAEFDDTELVRGLNEAKSSITSLTTNIEPISLFGPEVLQELDKLEQSTNSLEQSFNGLNSTSTGIGGTFQEIGDAANQAGDSFNTLGSSGATIEQQLAEIGTTSSTAGQSIQALGAEADTTGGSMGALANNFTETTGTSATLMQGLDDSTASFKGLGEEAEGTGSKLKDIFSKGSGIAVGISATISGVANLVRGFRDYGDAQLKVQKTTRTLGVQQLAAKDLQQKYNVAVSKYGANSDEAVKAGTKYQLKLDQIANTQRQLEIQTKHAGDSQLQVWLGMGATITGVGGSIIQSLDAIGGTKGIGGLVSKFGAAQFAVGGFSTSLAGLISGFTIVATGIIIADHLLKQDTATMVAFTAAGIKLTTVQDDSIRSFAEMQKIIDVTHMSMLQIVEDPAKAAAAYKAMGGEVDSSGKIVLSNAEMMEGKPKSAFQMLSDLLFGVKPAAEAGTTGIKETGTAIKSAADVTKGYIPTVIHLSSATRQIGFDTFEAYTRGGKALDFYGVEQQKTNKTVLDAYENFKLLYQSHYEGGILVTKLAAGVKDVNATLKDHGAEIKAAAAAQYGYDASVKSSIDDHTKYKTTLTGVMDEVNNSLGIWAKAGDVVIKMGADYVDLGNATKLQTMAENDLKNGTNDLTATIADAIKINNEYNKSFEDGIQMMRDHGKEVREAIQTELTLNKVGLTHNDIMSSNNDMNLSLAATIDEVDNAYKAEEKSLSKILYEHQLLIPDLAKLTTNQEDNTQVMKEAIITGLNWAAALTKGKVQLTAVTDGQLKAVTGMEEYTKGLVSANAEQQTTHKMLLQMIDTMGIKLPAGLNASNEELKTITDNFFDTKQAAAELAAVVEGPMADSFGNLSDIITAVTKQDFKDAFKDLKESLEHIIPEGGEDTIKHIKDMFKDLNKELFKGPDVAKAIDVLFVAIASGTDKLTSKDIKTVIDGIKNSLDSMGSVNPRAAMVSQEVFGPLEKLDGAALTSKISQIGDTIDLVKKAEADGWIDAKEYADIHHQLGVDMGTIPGPADAAATGIAGTGNEAGLAAPKLDAVAEALNSVILAGEDVGKRMAAIKFDFPPPQLDKVAQAFTDIGAAGQDTAKKIQGLKYIFPAPNLSQAAQALTDVFRAAQQTASKISALRPTITINNSQALSAISKVVSAMNSVKNISRTITITTRYVTVGRPAAHNVTTGVRAHNITGGIGGIGGIGGGATETPITALETTASNQVINTNGGFGGGQGNVNITIINRDEFGTEKIRKFKAVLGKDRYLFGAVGSGG